MIGSVERLEEFDRWYASEVLSRRSYHEALRVFAALWRHARRLNPEFPGNWEEDVKADIELARVLNGLPG